jgi:hypothetical protein
MDPQKPKTSAKDFFLNLGAIVALYTVVISLLNLLFTVINRAYPQITSYDFTSSSNISWPVSVLIIFFPIFILLSWFLEKGFKSEPEKRNIPVRKWLTYITLFVSGIVLAGDLVSVIYYFIDGQEVTTGFLLKVAAVFVVILGVFLYYISDIRGKLTTTSQRIWAILAAIVIIASISWGFLILGSPHTQQLYKLDNHKVDDLLSISYQIESYYNLRNSLPASLDELSKANFSTQLLDSQTGKSYEYVKTGNTKYSLCAEFNKASPDAKQSVTRPVGSWTHAAGHVCFDLVVNQNNPGKPVPAF